jgi:hypothetical protein
MARHRRVVLCAGLVVALAACRAERRGFLEDRREIVAGVELFRSADPALVDNAGPIAVSLLRIDPSRARLESALSNEQVVDTETVDGIAQRRGAIAAVNGGFFNQRNGEPVGLLKVGGELVSDNRAAKGAVIIGHTDEGRTTLTFDLVSARVTAIFTAGDREWRVPIDGVDTTRQRGRLMLYTPAYHDDTDTAPTGTEWVLDGDPLRVVDVLSNYGRTRIPRKGAVLSFGGLELPEHLTGVIEDVRVRFETAWRSLHGVDPAVFDTAESIVNGAGLLRRGGVQAVEWSREELSPEAFTAARHPRTLVGTDARGFIWLVTVDGRQPDYSVGMTFADLQRLCDRLELRDALNLDGGGSTTMVVKGQIVNRPSDPTGPRPVSDAILVVGRH